jgi:hypothetical protein
MKQTSVYSRGFIKSASCIKQNNNKHSYISINRVLKIVVIMKHETRNRFSLQNHKTILTLQSKKKNSCFQLDSKNW